MDIHLGGGGGVEMAENMFNTYPNYTMGAVNAETNAGIHTMTRAVRILPCRCLLLHGSLLPVVVVGVRNRCQRLRT